MNCEFRIVFPVQGQEYSVLPGEREQVLFIIERNISW